MTNIVQLPTYNVHDGLQDFRQFNPATDLHSDLAGHAYAAYQELGMGDPRRTVRKSKFDMGGSHTTVTYPPLFALQPSSAGDVWSVNRLGSSVDLYVHIAFCETMCTFCPYDVEQPFRKETKVEQYLKAVKQELSAYASKLAEADARVHSIYIGGGTPTVLSVAQLRDLVEHMTSFYDLEGGLPFCVEGSPLTITAPEGREKLEMLHAHGVTRLSMGVQSFDDLVLKNTARAYDSETAQAAVSIAMAVFDNVNIDLIQDLRGQTLNHIERDLEMVARLMPPSVTWYNQRVTPDVADFKLMHRRKGEYDDETTSLIARLMIFERMRELGYCREYGDKFVRDPRFADGFKKTRSNVATELIGIGSSAYSHANGFFFRNVKGADEYIARVAQEGVSIAQALPLTAEERFAGMIVHGLKSGIDLDAIAVQIGNWRAAHFMRKHRVHEKLERLAGEGLVRVAGTAVHLTERGRLLENEVARMFYSPAVEKTLSRKVHAAASPLWRDLLPLAAVYAAGLSFLIASIGYEAWLDTHDPQTAAEHQKMAEMLSINGT